MVTLVAGEAWGQRTLIDITLEPSDIRIGEQTIMNVSVTTDRNKVVDVYIPGESLMGGVEILTASDPDTTFIDNDRLIIKQDLLITSFDSALYLLPPLYVIDGSDTIRSNQVALKVSTVPVDEENPDRFYDIKTLWKPKFVFADFYPAILGIQLLLLLICILGYLFTRKRVPAEAQPAKPAQPLLPPHLVAIKELDEIKHQKLWQQGRDKEYFTMITDTLRKYMVDRFGINAMEMTSGEILDTIRKMDEADSVYVNLKQIMELSDFVKFAKFKPLPDENDLSMMNAYLFVNQTKPVPPLKAEKEESETTEDTNSTND